MASSQDSLTYAEFAPAGTGELPSTYRFGSEGSVATQVLDVTKPTEPADIARAILGWSTWNPAKKVIERHVPLACGAAPWLYAAGLDMHAAGKRRNVAAAVPAKQVGYAAGEWWRCHVTFKSLPYQVEADPPATRLNGFGMQPDVIEYHRYAEWQLTPGIEIIERQINGQFKYVNGPNANTTFPRNIQRRAPKSHLLLRQHQMPHGALFQCNHVLKPNFYKALGRVNDRTWPNQPSSSDPVTPLAVAGYRAGVVLLTQIGLNPVEAPVSPATVGCSPRSNVPRLWTLDLHFVVFDPPDDPAKDYGGSFGHQLVPSMSADLNANYYYLVSSTGTIDGKLIYDAVNFDDLLFSYG
jgi:hypothetical protein